ncbi:hypothetical protein CCP1ISM_4650001 [Azospirillaceae bacterium]
MVAARGAAAKVEYVETALAGEADALAEAAQFAADFARPRRAYEYPVADGAPGIWLGDTVRVTDHVVGFETGGRAVVYGRSVSDRSTRQGRGGGATLYLLAEEP